MSYKQSLQDFLKKLDAYERLRALQDSLDPMTAINNILKRLDTGDWKVTINNRYRTNVTVGKLAVKDYDSMKIEPFEDFKSSLVEAVLANLMSKHARKYTSIEDFEEKAVNVAAELINKIDEDLYEDIMAVLRGMEENNTKKTGNQIRKKVSELGVSLYGDADELASEWLRDNIAPGMKVFILTPVFGIKEVEKVARSGGAVALKLKGVDQVITNLDGIDASKAWETYVKEAGDIYARLP